MEKENYLEKTSLYIESQEKKLIENEINYSKELSSLVCNEIKLLSGAVKNELDQYDEMEKNMATFQKNSLNKLSDRANIKLNDALAKWRIF